MCALLRDERDGFRSPFPTDIPADSVITFRIRSNLSPGGFDGLDEIISDEIAIDVEHVYGNFVSAKKSCHFARGRNGEEEMEYIFHVPAPSSWEQLDSLILQLNFTCDILLENEWAARFFVNWRGEPRVNDDFLSMID